MDAVKYLKEKIRMCKTVGDCIDNCPVFNNFNKSCGFLEDDNPEAIVDIVETWSKENPILTNSEKFKEVFGFSLTKEQLKLGSFIGWLDQEYKGGGKNKRI